MNNSLAIWLPLVLVVGLLLVRLFGGSASQPPDAADPRADQRNWIGPIYNNSDDPRLFVPKRFGYGTTLNFGRPLGKAFLIAILLLAVLPLLFRLLSR